MIDPPLPRFYPHYPVEKQVKISGISRVSLSDSISSIILDCYDRKIGACSRRRAGWQIQNERAQAMAEARARTRSPDSLDAWLPFSRQPDTKWPG